MHLKPFSLISHTCLTQPFQEHYTGFVHQALVLLILIILLFSIQKTEVYQPIKKPPEEGNISIDVLPYQHIYSSIYRSRVDMRNEDLI
mgnify:CR=1 FL=1